MDFIQKSCFITSDGHGKGDFLGSNFRDQIVTQKRGIRIEFDTSKSVSIKASNLYLYHKRHN